MLRLTWLTVVSQACILTKSCTPFMSVMFYCFSSMNFVNGLSPSLSAEQSASFSLHMFYSIWTRQQLLCNQGNAWRLHFSSHNFNNYDILMEMGGDWWLFLPINLARAEQMRLLLGLECILANRKITNSWKDWLMSNSSSSVNRKTNGSMVPQNQHFHISSLLCFKTNVCFKKV